MKPRGQESWYSTRGRNTLFPVGTTTQGPSTGVDPTADDTTGPDGTTTGDDTTGGFDACKQVDFLFVIDNSVSMEGEQVVEQRCPASLQAGDVHDRRDPHGGDLWVFPQRLEDAQAPSEVVHCPRS